MERTHEAHGERTRESGSTATGAATAAWSRPAASNIVCFHHNQDLIACFHYIYSFLKMLVATKI